MDVINVAGERIDVHLTRREAAVFACVQQGLTNREIAEKLVIELGTAKNHVHNLMHKLGLHSRRDFRYLTLSNEGVSVSQPIHDTEMRAVLDVFNACRRRGLTKLDYAVRHDGDEWLLEPTTTSISIVFDNHGRLMDVRQRGQDARPTSTDSQ